MLHYRLRRSCFKVRYYFRYVLLSYIFSIRCFVLCAMNCFPPISEADPSIGAKIFSPIFQSIYFQDAIAVVEEGM